MIQEPEEQVVNFDCASINCRTGQVVLAEGVTLDEASRAFWDLLEKTFYERFNEMPKPSFVDRGLWLDRLMKCQAGEMSCLRLLDQLEIDMNHEYAYARLGETLLNAAKARVVSGDMSEEDEEIMRLAEKFKAGKVRQVAYDPEKHGAIEWAATGDPIWWWGE